MSGVFDWLIPVAIGAVAATLVFGLISLFRGDNPSRSNRLMRLRVLLQFIAIIILMLAAYMRAK